MNDTTILGLFAGALTSVAIVPQVARAYRTKRVRDISVWQPVILVAGMILWFAYGLMIGDIPLIVANIFSLVCNIVLIAMKFRYREGDIGSGDDYPVRKIESTEEQ